MPSSFTNEVVKRLMAKYRNPQVSIPRYITGIAHVPRFPALEGNIGDELPLELLMDAVEPEFETSILREPPTTRSLPDPFVEERTRFEGLNEPWPATR